MTTARGRATRGLYFLRCFLRNPREVGAVCPSTRALGDAMLTGLDLKRGDVVVEYGAGTGSLTESIWRRSRELGGLRYLGIEREAGFCRVLRERMPDFDFACAQVEDVEALLAERGLPAPKAIISGLPLILLPTMDSIVATASRVVAPGGSFRTFTYLQSSITPNARRLRRLIREHFDGAGSSPLIWRNFPPAWVLRGDRAVA